MKPVAARWTRLLACVVATTGLAGPLAAEAKDHHILWTVAGKHNTVYLLGSIHVLRADDEGLPDVAEAAYRDAEQLVMEIDMDDPATDDLALATQMQQMAMLPPGQTLRSVLGPDYAAFDAHARKQGLDASLLDRFAPWFVSLAMMQTELAKRGFQPEFGIEETIAGRAKHDHKPITGLETPEQQFGMLAGMPLPLQRRLLMMTVGESDDIDAELAGMLGAWKRGDAAQLARVLGNEFQEFPELYGPLTEDRNRAWAPRIADLLDDDDDYLVVVGALHLVGPDSVVDLLRKRGYRVEQQ